MKRVSFAYQENMRKYQVWFRDFKNSLEAKGKKQANEKGHLPPLLFCYFFDYIISILHSDKYKSNKTSSD